MAYEPHIPEITAVIQLAVAPVFMLTAVGTIISALSIRLGRAVDRRRELEAGLPPFDEPAPPALPPLPLDEPDVPPSPPVSSSPQPTTNAVPSTIAKTPPFKPIRRLRIALTFPSGSLAEHIPRP